MYVRAFDGIAWSSWDSFTLSSTNTAPVATINDHALSAAQWAQVVNWTTASDADGDAITKYQFWDGGTAADSGYFWTPTNSHWAAATAIEVDAADLANVWVKGGVVGGSETMYVRAFDGTSWGAWDSFAFTTLPNNAPVTTINNQTLHINEWMEIQNVLSYSDADGHPATQYQFWDGGTGANTGYFWTPTNSHWAAATVIDVNAADLDDIWVRGGATAGTETMYARAFGARGTHLCSRPSSSDRPCRAHRGAEAARDGGTMSGLENSATPTPSAISTSFSSRLGFWVYDAGQELLPLP